MIRMLSVALVLGLIVSAAPADEKRVEKPVEKREKVENPLDKDFLIESVQCGNNCENVLSVVEKNTSSDKVKQFATSVKKDHQELRKQHGEVAKEKKVVVIPSLDKEAREQISDLKKKDKDDFDKAFLTMFIEGHEKAIKMAEYQKKNGKDEDVSKLADKMLTTLKDHLKRAKELKADLK